MQHTLTPYAVEMPPYAYWEGAFSDSELNILQESAMSSVQQAQVGGQLNTDELNRIRRSKISWLHKNNETSWIFEKLSHVVSSLNAQFYRFNLTGFGENIQLTNYDQSENGMYGWHVDYGGKVSPSRKLSLVLQLTDLSQYEGGNLQIMTTGEPQTIRKQRGLIVVFPSYVLHQVTPVTYGSRQSLVSWLTGPAFV